MAHDVKLECFSFVILDKDKEQVDLNAFFEGTDFVEFFRKWVRFMDGETFEHGSTQKSLELDFSSIRFDSGSRMVHGIVHGGYYGIGGAQKNLDTKTTDFRKTHRHTDETPFYYLMNAPVGKKHGMIIIQTLGGKTVTELFRWRLKSYFREHYQGLNLKIEYYVSKNTVRQFIQENPVKAVLLRKYLVPGDVADQMGGYQRDKYMMEFKLANTNSGFLSPAKIMRFVNSQDAHFFTTPALESLGFDGSHKTILQVKSGKSTRLVDMGDIYKFKPAYSIDHEVTKDIDYNPVLRVLTNAQSVF